MPNARVVELIEMTVVEGKGTEPNPNRHVVYYFRLTGEQVARVDQWEAEVAKPIAEGGEDV